MVTPLHSTDPSRIGSYALHARLGGGGMGQVFLGSSPGGRTVAVKMVRPELAGTEFRRRFADEIRAARRVGGFYTAQVVDADTDGDPPWLATAYVPGPSLQQAVETSGPLPLATVTKLGAGLAEGLASVHGCNLVHRDLKPGNIILAEDGPRLIDFGVSRAMDATTYTAAQPVIGTVGFMSPEQTSGQEAAPPSDVFALGCVLTFAATGSHPFGEANPVSVLFRIVHGEPELSALPSSLEYVVTRCLAKTPENRPGVRELLAELAALAPHDQARPTDWLPEDVTTLLHRTRNATLVMTGDPVEEGAGHESGAPKALAPQTPLRPDPDATVLRIGNLTTEMLTVVCDGAVLGEVAAAGEGDFRTTPGPHTLQVRGSTGHGAVRKIDAQPGDTLRHAYDAPHPGATPVETHSVTFSQSRTSQLTSAVVLGPIMTLVVGVLLVVGVVLFFSQQYSIDELTATWPYILGASVLAGIVLTNGPLSALHCLTVDTDGYTVTPTDKQERSRTTWTDLEQVSLVENVLVVWRRDGSPLPAHMDLPVDIDGEEHWVVTDSVVVCITSFLDVKSNQDVERFRAAVRWFAGDRYVEQSHD